MRIVVLTQVKQLTKAVESDIPPRGTSPYFVLEELAQNHPHFGMPLTVGFTCLLLDDQQTISLKMWNFRFGRGAGIVEGAIKYNRFLA